MVWLRKVITVVATLAVVALFVMFLRSRVPEQKVGGGFLTSAKFRDGSHLAVGSPVVIAGVRIGDITRIVIEGQFARVDMNLQSGIQIPVDAFVTRRADSLFGDSYIEVIFAGGADGAAPARMLVSGEPITHVIEGASTDAVLRAMDRSLPRIDNALDVLHEVVTKGRKIVNGDVIEGMQYSDDWLGLGKIESPLTRTESAMKRIDQLTEDGASALANSAPEVLAQLDRIDRGVERARTNIKSAKSGLVTALQDARAGLQGADPQIEEVGQVLAAINEGKGDDWKGSLGRLVNDPTLADDIEDATAGLENALSSYDRFKSYLGLRLELNVFAKTPRIYATVEIAGRTDKFYLVEIESGSLGSQPGDELADDPNAPYTRRQSIGDGLRYTAQFGKRIGALRLRGGLKDSSPGVGADLWLMRGRLRLSADVFGSFDRTPRAKLTAAFAVFRSVYVLGGIDDAFNSPGYLPINPGTSPVPQALTEIRHGRDYFLGATLYLNEADLATLIRVYGALLIGSLAR